MAQCPKCFGRLKKKARKVRGGKSVYLCGRCKRKFSLNYETGRLEKIA